MDFDWYFSWLRQTNLHGLSIVGAQSSRVVRLRFLLFNIPNWIHFQMVSNSIRKKNIATNIAIADLTMLFQFNLLSWKPPNAPYSHSSLGREKILTHIHGETNIAKTNTIKMKSEKEKKENQNRNRSSQRRGTPMKNI